MGKRSRPTRNGEGVLSHHQDWDQDCGPSPVVEERDHLSTVLGEILERTLECAVSALFCFQLS